MGETVHPNVPWGLECPLNHSKNGNLSVRLVSCSEVMAKGRVVGAEACDLIVVPSLVGKTAEAQSCEALELIAFRGKSADCVSSVDGWLCFVSVQRKGVLPSRRLPSRW